VTLIGIPLKGRGSTSTLDVPVSDKPQCPRCKRDAFVRFETVIERGETHRSVYCGACDYSWNIADDGKESDSQDHEPPDRSRPRQ